MGEDATEPSLTLLTLLLTLWEDAVLPPATAVALLLMLLVEELLESDRERRRLKSGRSAAREEVEQEAEAPMAEEAG